MEIDKKIQFISGVFTIILICLAIITFLGAKEMLGESGRSNILPICLLLLIPFYLIGMKASYDLKNRKSWARKFLIALGILLTPYIIVVILGILLLAGAAQGYELTIIPIIIILGAGLLYSLYQLLFNKKIKEAFK